MLHPILPFTIKGILWYQGESNVSRAWRYRTEFPLLIRDLRTRMSRPDLPFYFCQVTNYGSKSTDPSDSRWAELREAQSRVAESVENTGMAVLIDLGESDCIHPGNKRDVGDRLARIALAKTYGKEIAFISPGFSESRIEEGKVKIRFHHDGSGLVARPLPPEYPVFVTEKKFAPLVRNSPNSEIEGFSICGSDRKWHWANARIDGDSVVVWADNVPDPVAVRYAWADNPTVNLYSGAGLPVSPFRTDDFPTLSPAVLKY
jgi:sialate O-acetylesterase